MLTGGCYSQGSQGIVTGSSGSITQKETCNKLILFLAIGVTYNEQFLSVTVNPVFKTLPGQENLDEKEV